MGNTQQKDYAQDATDITEYLTLKTPMLFSVLQEIKRAKLRQSLNREVSMALELLQIHVENMQTFIKHMLSKHVECDYQAIVQHKEVCFSVMQCIENIQGTILRIESVSSTTVCSLSYSYLSDGTLSPTSYHFPFRENSGRLRSCCSFTMRLYYWSQKENCHGYFWTVCSHFH